MRTCWLSTAAKLFDQTTAAAADQVWITHIHTQAVTSHAGDTFEHDAKKRQQIVYH